MERGGLYAERDATAAIENMLVAATALNLGAWWAGAFDEDKASETLDLPEHVGPIAIIPIGYPAEQLARRSRHPMEELAHYERRRCSPPTSAPFRFSSRPSAPWGHHL